MGAIGTRLSLRPLYKEGRSGSKLRTHRAARTRTHILTLYRPAPPPGLAFGEPDDRLRRGIQYAAAYRLNLRRLWNTGASAGACHRAAIRPTRWRTTTRRD